MIYGRLLILTVYSFTILTLGVIYRRPLILVNYSFSALPISLLTFPFVTIFLLDFGG